MSAPSKRQAATAHHEAGHAVVGLWERVPVRLIRASIIPDPEEGTLGHVLHGRMPRVRDVELGRDGRPRHFYRDFSPEFDDERLVERRLKPQIVMLFAGVIAETKFTGRRHNWQGATSDMRAATDFIAYVAPSPRLAQKYSDYLWVVAEDTVDRLWSDVEALATELLTRKTMSAREVIAFQRAWPPSDWSPTFVMRAAPAVENVPSLSPEAPQD